MKERLDFKSLSNRLGILIPNDFEIFNKGYFTDTSGVEFQIKTDFHEGFLYKNSTIKIIVDNFIELLNFETYWKGRMVSDLWIKNKRYLGLAKCIEPYGFLIWSLNDEDFGSIHFEYTYEKEGNTPKRILLANDISKIIERLKPYEFEDRK